jgi:ABC-type glycerol-3-phosphate transport system substrate-binding protein
MNWNFGCRAMLLALAATLLAGCAQVPRQAFNAQGSSHIRKVVVAQHENQTEYESNILGHPGMSFGLIGGLIAAADIQSKTIKLTSAINPKETRVQDRLSEKLKARLEQAGYETTVLVVPRGTKAEEALARAKQGGQADAVMLVDLYAGYWAAGPSTDYFPRMLARVKALDIRSDKVL